MPGSGRAHGPKSSLKRSTYESELIHRNVAESASRKDLVQPRILDSSHPDDENAETAIQHCPRDMQDDKWRDLCLSFMDEHFQKLSVINSGNRAKQTILHASGSKGFHRLEYELVEVDSRIKEKENEGITTDDAEVFLKVLGHRSGHLHGRGAGPKPMSSHARRRDIERDQEVAKARKESEEARKEAEEERKEASALREQILKNYKALAQQPSQIYNNETAMTKPDCPFRCSGDSNVTIPYPFGIGRNCARDETFIITCDTSFHPPRPFISGINLQVLSISIDDAWVRVDNPLESTNPNLSSSSSEFSKTYSTNVLDWAIDGNCSRGLLLGENGAINSSHSCGQHSECKHYLSDTRFYCTCLSGYEGNPYLPDGCQDVDECARPESSYCTGECVNTPGSFKCMTPKKKIAMIGMKILSKIH
ncbi:hypothetical protein LguiA_026295 [Lonicera macranthoides]